MHDLGQRIRQPAGAHVVDGENRIAGAERPATIDHLLAAALHLGVAALDRVEVEVGGVGAGIHARRRAAAQADRHARAAELHQRRAHRHVGLERLVGTDVAQPAGDHDRLVEAAHAARDFLLIGTEVTGQIGAAELVVERGAADRPLDHDVERRGDAVRLAAEALLPRLGIARDAQVRGGEAGQACLGSRATSGRALVADLAAGAGRRAGIRRDGGRMVVGLDLHQDVREPTAGPIDAVLARDEVRDLRAFHHGGIVGVGDDRVLRRGGVGVADHAEQRVRLRLAVDHPGRIEDLVAAVLRVGLREHHEFDVGRVTVRRDESIDQVADLVVGQRQAEVAVGGFDGNTAAAQQVDARDRRRLDVGEHTFESGIAVEHGLGHAIVDQCGHGSLLLGGEAALGGDSVFDAALQPEDRGEPALTRDLGGLG